MINSPLVGKVVVVLLIVLAFLLAACESAETPPPPDELTRMITAQESATAAAREAQQRAGDLQRVVAQATTRADATRDAAVLFAQQTRLVDQAHQTQTLFAQDARATQTQRAALESRTAEAGRYTSTAQSAQFTATAHADSRTATAFAQNAFATAQQAQAVGTTNAQNAQATAASASATSTAQAQAVQATRVEASARETVTFAATQKRVEQENWERLTEGAWAIFKIVVMIAVAGLFCLAFFRAIQIWVLRRRAFRDSGGELAFYSQDEQGNETWTRPGRMPGAVVQITLPGKPPRQIGTGAVDPETTKRDQAVSLMLAANAGKGNAGVESIEEITASPRVQRINEPPPELLLPGVRERIDSEWKVLNATAKS